MCDETKELEAVNGRNTYRKNIRPGLQVDSGGEFMTRNKITQWLLNNKIGLIIGFIFGAFIAPFLAVLGLGSVLFAALRPLLIGPMDFIGNFIPNVQTGPRL